MFTLPISFIGPTYYMVIHSIYTLAVFEGLSVMNVSQLFLMGCLKVHNRPVPSAEFSNLLQHQVDLGHHWESSVWFLHATHVSLRTGVPSTASYKDRAFGNVSLAPFLLGMKNSASSLQPAVFEGHIVIDLKPHQVDEYYTETHAGIFKDLVVDLDHN
ncbi:hypothetical protein RIF29_15775 [Crotalaria pallida]|uniref:Uncharacterized protein n=1 Tax=Crotalaria pallida TaxID=3830 RepID=A0AAN9FL31_CROPI